MINKIDFPESRGSFYCGSTFLIQYYSATGQVINYRFIPPIESDSNYIKFQKVIENTIRNTLSDNISSFNIQEKINYIIENIEDSSKFPKFQGVIKFKKP